MSEREARCGEVVREAIVPSEDSVFEAAEPLSGRGKV